jgi:hypothetical protein
MTEVTAVAAEASFDVKVLIDTKRLATDVGFNPDDLDSAMSEHSPLFVHYTVLASKARVQYERIKMMADVYDAKLNAKHREAILAAGDKATEASVTAAVKSDPAWAAIQMRVIEARGVHEIANGACEAFKQRSSMIIQTAADRRKEREGEMRMGVTPRSFSEKLAEDTLRQMQDRRDK